jgi:predicted Zn-dependent protease
LRDADEVGLQATRVSPEREMQLGAEIAQRTGGWGPEDPEASKYVTAVGEELTPAVDRKAIRYDFHVIQSPEINAFALPGGHVYVLSGLLDFLQSEAELAAIVGHEISHVDLRHCIERYQYELALRKLQVAPVGEMVTIAHQLVAVGYAQDQELEADASGERLAIEAGYDPDAAAAVFLRMKAKFGEPDRVPAATPAGEAGKAVGEAIGSYFRSHPPSAERARRLSEMVERNRRELAGHTVYRGVENYRRRIPRRVERFPGEQRTF